MSTDLVVRQPGQIAAPPGARMLGQRVKPIIRLGMGVKVEGERRDGSKYTRPSKTDHFTVRGDERAVAKFRSVYGEKPKAVKIMVPSELGLALDISYRSFVGGQEEGDGRPLALGMTNFAPLGYVGGPDVLRVWKQDGTYAEIETDGLDELGEPLDEIANDLKIEVYATFTFTIPEVLGWGSFAAVTSKGKKSADNLAFKLGQIYSAFGSKAPWAFDRDEPPMLVLKPDTAMMRFEEKDGSAWWGKTSIFVLDIVIPEAFDDMVDRLAERQAQIAPMGPAAALYGDERPALEAGSAQAPRSPGEDGTEQAAETPVAEAEREAGASPSDSPSETDGTSPPAPADNEEPVEEVEGELVEEEEERQFAAPEGVDANHPDVVAANEAAELTFESGKYAGQSVRQIADDGDDGAGYLRWVMRNWKAEGFRVKVEAYCRVYLPDVYQEVMAQRETAS